MGGQACRKTLTEAVQDDDSSWHCKYTRNQQPQYPSFCYESSQSVPPNFSRPTFLAYLGSNGMRIPSAVNAKRFKQDLVLSSHNEKEVMLHYEVELGDMPIVSLDDLQDVMKVECSSSHEEMTLHVLDESRVSGVLNLVQQDHAVVVGGREWGCQFGPINEVRTILHHVLDAAVRGRRIILKTQLASHSAVFKH